MTDRDHFAAAALTGLLVNANGDIDEDTLDTPSDLAYTAYEMADALLRVRDSRTADTANHDAAPAASAVTGTGDTPRAMLTDAEREAVERLACACETSAFLRDPVMADTLRGLLERIK